MTLSDTIIKAAHFIGMDGAIAYGSSARVFQAFAGVVTVFLISAFLTGIEQGYYFTFHSLLAVQTFFELGFTNIITQFVSHEAAYIQIKGDSEIGGESYNISRLSSLMHFCIKWYMVASLLFFLILFVVGFLFFKNAGDDNVVWQSPWIILSIATAIKLFQSPFSAILMGLDKVKDINKIIFYQQVLSPLFMWLSLVLGWGLYVVGISSLVSVLVWFYIIWRSKLYKVLYSIYLKTITNTVSYFKEIFPYQWRIALSSLSGFFIFHFLTPILFKYQGATVAGQVGMSISIISAIQAFSMTWLNTKVPTYSKLIALKDYAQLDKLFNVTMKQMVTICSVIMILAYLALNMISWWGLEINGSLLGERYLTGLPLAILMVGYITDQFSFSWATYLRCHKKEPFLVNSVVVGAACLLVIFIFSKYSSIFITLFAYSLVRVLGLPWGYAIFITKKKEWHQ
jgi:O-antigen/teichoic acid export membrane protein